VAYEEEASLMVARATIFRCPTDEEALAVATNGAMVVVSRGAMAATFGGDVAATSDGDVVAVTSGVMAAMLNTDVVVALSVVEILEEKVFVQLRKSEDHDDAKIWIMDTRATNHLSGSVRHLLNSTQACRSWCGLGMIMRQELKVAGWCNLCTTFLNSRLTLLVWVGSMRMDIRSSLVGVC
jgi:hypothetical protein